jgi:Bacterial protein of unknown function (DUF948)
MTAGDWAAVAAAGAAVLAVVGLLVAMASLTRTLAALRITVDDLRRQTVPLIGDVQATVRQANAELERVDGLLGTAESISTTVDSASRLAYLAFSNPVIKALALGAGTSRAVKRFRRSNGD